MGLPLPGNYILINGSDLSGMAGPLGPPRIRGIVYSSMETEKVAAGGLLELTKAGHDVVTVLMYQPHMQPGASRASFVVMVQ